MYKLLKQKNKFRVIEIESDNVIKEFDTHEEANELYQSLKSGHGFEGWTPAFILTSFF
jgi:hypothetical protein